jgi:hypothetical protein
MHKYRGFAAIPIGANRAGYALIIRRAVQGRAAEDRQEQAKTDTEAKKNIGLAFHPIYKFLPCCFNAICAPNTASAPNQSSFGQNAVTLVALS